jgi:hypothetical protein
VAPFSRTRKKYSGSDEFMWVPFFGVDLENRGSEL